VLFFLYFIYTFTTLLLHYSNAKVGSLLSSIYVGKTEFEVVDRVNTVTKLRDPSNGNNFLKSRLTIEQLRKTLCQGVQQTELN